MKADEHAPPTRTPLRAGGQLVKEVADHIRDRIVSGRETGTAFMRLDRVADELGTSVTPVREALLQLKSEGFVDWQPRRGFRVIPLSTADIEDIYQVQAFIAAELAKRATRRLSTHDVELLREIQTKLEAALTDGDQNAVEELNYEFHKFINRAAEAPKLAWALKIFVRFSPREFFPQIEGWAEASASEHRAIIQALMDRDADAAARTMSAHVQRAGVLLATHHQALRHED